MTIDPSAVGAVTEPALFEWTDRDTLLYALGVGAGLDDLSFTTENSHDIDQQVLPTYAETVGTLETGKYCDLAIWNITQPAELVYRMGFNPLHARVWRGQ